ncbi:Galactose binding lectin [Plasmodiophora brassicae]
MTTIAAVVAIGALLALTLGQQTPPPEEHYLTGPGNEWDVSGTVKENEMTVLKCNGGQFSQVRSVSYGDASGSCKADPQALTDLVLHKCDGTMQCRLTANTETLGPDPCPGTPKVLNVTLLCSRLKHKN